MLVLVNILIGVTLLALVGWMVFMILWARSYSYIRGYRHAQGIIVGAEYRINTISKSNSCVVFGKPGHTFSVTTKDVLRGRKDVLPQSFIKGMIDCVISHNVIRI